MRRTLAAGITAVVAVLLTLPGVAAAQTAEPQIKIREVALDDDGSVRLVIQPVGPGADSLTADDLTVSESGVVIEDLRTNLLRDEEARTVAVALLIDVSGSMLGEPLAVTKQAATAFVERLADAGVRVILVTFANTARVIARTSDSPGTVIGSIQALEADGNTALYDAVIAGSTELARLPDAQANLVVFTDGGDTASQATLDAAITAAQEADAPIGAVTLATAESDLDSLALLTGATGGSTYASADVGQLDAAFTTVARELTTQYVVRYASTRADLRELDIQVRWQGPSVAASDTVTVLNPRRAEAPPITSYRRASPGLLGSQLGLIVGISGVFLGSVLVLSLLLARPGGQASKLLERDLSAYLSGTRSSRGRSSAIAHVLRRRAEAFFETAPRPEGLDERLRHRLEQAAWPLRTTEFYAISLLAGLVLVVPALVMLTWWIAPVAFVIGAVIPWVVLDVQRGRRRRAFLSRFPDTLQLLAGSLRAGYGIVQAFDSVGRESGPPTSEEFARVLTEARLGAPLEDALDGLADRMDSEDVRWVVLAIKIQREVGGNLAELLTTVARTLREREALRRQIRVLSAEGKLSAVVLIVLPFLLAIYLSLANPAYVRVLIDNRIGWAMIGGAVGLMGAGVLWIRNMIKIEV